MTPNEALKLTLARYDIKQVDLVRAAADRGEKLAPNQLSGFINGGDLKTETLTKIINALITVDPEAHKFFFALWEGRDMSDFFSDRPKLIAAT